MTTEQFYQIASYASMIQDLADKGAELSNAERISRENREFEHKNSRQYNANGFGIEVEHYVNAKARIEERIKAKNEELQKLILKNKNGNDILSDKQIEELIWEDMPISLSQIDIDTHSDGYKLYLNAVHWAKWGRDNYNGL